MLYLLVGESFEDVNSSLEEWKGALEGKGLRISMGNTEYKECGFGETEYRANSYG